MTMYLILKGVHKQIFTRLPEYNTKCPVPEYKLISLPVTTPNIANTVTTFCQISMVRNLSYKISNIRFGEKHPINNDPNRSLTQFLEFGQKLQL